MRVKAGAVVDESARACGEEASSVPRVQKSRRPKKKMIVRMKASVMTMILMRLMVAPVWPDGASAACGGAALYVRLKLAVNARVRVVKNFPSVIR